MRSRHCRPLGLQLGIVIGVPVEFALTAMVCEFRRTGAVGPDQPGRGAVKDGHASGGSRKRGRPARTPTISGPHAGDPRPHLGEP